jgi:hypothetical protein
MTVWWAGRRHTLNNATSPFVQQIVQHGLDAPKMNCAAAALPRAMAIDPALAEACWPDRYSPIPRQDLFERDELYQSKLILTARVIRPGCFAGNCLAQVSKRHKPPFEPPIRPGADGSEVQRRAWKSISA